MADNKDPEVQEKKLSRRNFLKKAGLTVGGLAVGAGVGSLLAGEKETDTKKYGNTKHTAVASENYNQALMFFTKEQFQVMDEMTERIFPKTGSGPGAKELLVAYFIDHQLAGAWGTGKKEYTQGPFIQGEPTQGYQSHLNRQQVFEMGIKAIDVYSQKNYENKKFIELTDEEKDEVLTAFSEGKAEMRAVTSNYFFGLVRSATLEGAYSDPLYGGNKDMAGWKMKNFPGHQMSFLDIIEKDEFIKMEPKGLNPQHKH